MKKLFFLAMSLLLLVNVSTAASQETNIDGIAAIVNDKVITQNQVAHQAELIESQLRKSNQAIPDQATLNKQVLQQLINVSLQMQAAKASGITALSDDVDDYIKQIAKRNNLSVKQLKQRIEQDGISYRQYRDNIKKQITIARLQQSALSKDIKISEAQIDSALKAYKQQQKANDEYRVRDILVPLASEPSSAELIAAKKRVKSIQAKLKQGKSFNDIAVSESSGASALKGGDLGWRKLAELPEVFSQEIINLQKGQVAGPIRTGNGFHLIQLVDKRSQDAKKFVTQYHVQQILLRNNPDKNSNYLRAELQKIRAKAIKGESFAALAKQYSQDVNAKTNGGDLGWLSKQEVPKDFAASLSDLKIGDISQPIATQYGWHLIRLEGTRKVNVANKLAREQMRQMLYRRQFEHAANKYLQRLRAGAYIKVLS